MARLLRSNGALVGAQITLFPGNRLQLRVSGLGPNRKHLVLKSSDSALRVVPLKVNDKNIEQVLRLEVQEHSIVCRRVVHVDAYVTDAQGRPQHKDINTARLTVEVAPRLTLPDENSEAGILARMLIVENASPDHEKYVNQSEARESMQWMVHVLRNRLRLGPQHFAARGATDLTALIKGRNQVKGFENYPTIAASQNQLLNHTLDIAHDGTHARQKEYITYVASAVAVAKGENIDPDPSPTGLYAWRTSDSRDPGHNFRRFRSKGGQDFYTLTDAFLAGLQPKVNATR
ncbi:hypothetical protein [Cupriavidus campinensis]